MAARKIVLAAGYGHHAAQGSHGAESSVHDFSQTVIRWMPNLL
ncbi:MAG: hypothetical protein SPH31_07620 [Arcanobacterium sp.]|nr:hypothetical protein [Arcanobacterium sp.]